MVIIMDMEDGPATFAPAPDVYDDEVLDSGWTDVPHDVPQYAPALQVVATQRRQEPTPAEVEQFMASIYCCQQ